MSLQATCPHCQAALAVPDRGAGKTVRCPKCRGEFTAPAAEEPKPLESIATAPAPAAEEPAMVEPVGEEKARTLRRPAPARKRSSIGWIIGGVVLAVVLLFCGGAGLVVYWFYSNIQDQLAQSQTRKAALEAKKNVAFADAPDRGGEPADLMRQIKQKAEFMPPGGPPGGMNPAAQQQPGRLELPPLPAAVPIKPAPIQTATTYKLPDTVEDLAVGGGGRFLILYFSALHKLGIFDANEGRITHYVSVVHDRIAFAAGMNKLLVYAPGASMLERWDLLTRKREKSEALRGVANPVHAFCMGSASAGPLLLCAGEQQNFAAHMVDIDTFQLQSIPSADPFGSPFGSLPHRASANGRVFTHSGKSIVLESGQARSFPVPGNHFYVLPGPDGKHVYVGGHGVLTNQFQPTSDAVYSPVRGDGMCEHSYIPAEHGPYYMHLHLKSGLLGPYGLPHNRDDPEHGVTIYLLGERQPIAQMANIGMITYGTKDALQNIGFERSVHLIPRAHLLVVLPGSRDRLLLHPIDVEKKLDESGVKYLLVTSLPPAEAQRGQTLTYAITARSKAGGIKYNLESGPKDMTLSAEGKLTWTVPADFADKQAEVIVRVEDANKQERFHTFTLAIVDGK